MTATILLRPGRVPIADWRAIHAGARVEIDPLARLDVEAGRMAAAALPGDGYAADAEHSPAVADLIEARGALLPAPRLRLLPALKLASLAQGVSGVRWALVRRLAELLNHDVLPQVPQAADDRLALSHLLCSLSGGPGAVLHKGKSRPAAEVLRGLQLEPLSLDGRERRTLLSGDAPMLASVLSDLFDAERVAQASVIAAAYTLAAEGRGDPTLHPIVHRLQRQRGQMDVAGTLRVLFTGDEDSGAGTSHAKRPADAALIFRLGAAFDLLRQAAAILERAANGVPEEELVLWQTGEAVAGMADPAAPALAADLVATALLTIGETLAGEVRDGEAAARAERLAAANRERTATRPLDAGTMAKLAPIVTATAEIVAVALLAASGKAQPPAGGALAGIARLVAEAAPEAGDEGAIGQAVATLAGRVRSGGLAVAMGVALLSSGARPGERIPGNQPETVGKP